MHKEQLKKDFNEIVDKNIINDLKSILRNRELNFDAKNDQITTDLLFIRKFVTTIKSIHILFNFSSDNFKKMIGTLSTSNIKVCFYG